MVRTMLGLLLITLPATAAEPTDLAGMQRAYGWSTIATIVSATAHGDLSNADAHAQLAQLGLGTLVMPVRGAWTEASLTDCGWNEAIVCRLEIPASTPVPEALACTRRGQHLLDVNLRLTVATPPRGNAPGEAWVEDLLPCWRAGGTDVKVIPAAKADLSKVTIEATGASAREAIERVRTHFSLLQQCGPGRLVWSTDPDGRATILKVDDGAGQARQPGTSCAQDVLGKVRLSSDVQLFTEL